MMLDVMGTAIAVVMCGQPEGTQAGDAPERGAPAAEAAEAEPVASWDDVPPAPVSQPVVESAPPQPEGPSKAELERVRARSKARGLLIGGWTTFGITYAAALTIGVASIDLAEDDLRQRRYGRRMTIPVGGPFAAAFISKSATGTLFTVLTGAAQLTGIAIGTAGAVMLAKHRREPRLALAIVPGRYGTHVGASWRF
jgi:hypothetical protein